MKSERNATKIKSKFMIGIQISGVICDFFNPTKKETKYGKKQWL